MSSAWASLFGFPPSSSIEVKHEPARQRAAATRFSIKTHSPKFPQQLQAPSVVISRRGINGLGFSVGFLQLLFREDYLFMQSRETAMAEEPPCILTKTPSGLAYCDRVVGTGAKATKGELIKAHYIGKLENGIVFDSSYKYGRPLVFRVGVGEVIKGWDQGILGGDGIPPMFSGGKRTLKLPPQLGYGMRGAGCKGGSCVIPPDSVLVFDVEFVGKA